LFHPTAPAAIASPPPEKVPCNPLGDGFFGGGNLQADLSSFDLLSPPYFRTGPAQGREDWLRELQIEKEEEAAREDGWVAV